MNHDTSLALAIEHVIVTVLYMVVAGRAAYEYARARAQGYRSNAGRFAVSMTAVFALCGVSGYLLAALAAVWAPAVATRIGTEAFLILSTLGLIGAEFHYRIFWGICTADGQREAEAVRADAAEAASRAIIEALPIPAVYIAPGREIVGATYEDVNAAACEVWNRTYEELTSQPYDAFVADDPEATRAAAEAVDAGGSVDGFTSTYTVPERAPVTQRWLEIKGTGWWIALPINAEVRARAEAERFARAAESAEARAAHLGAVVGSAFDDIDPASLKR